MSAIAITDAENNHFVSVWLIVFLKPVGACTVYMRGLRFKSLRSSNVFQDIDVIVECSFQVDRLYSCRCFFSLPDLDAMEVF